MDPSVLLPVLAQTLVPDTAKSRDATRALTQGASTPGFTIALFSVCANPATDINVRQAAATFVKNHVKRNWVSARRNSAHGRRGRGRPFDAWRALVRRASPSSPKCVLSRGRVPNSLSRSSTGVPARASPVPLLRTHAPFRAG
jgi:hypothetical protein